MDVEYMSEWTKAVMRKLRPAGQMRPPEMFYPARATLFLIWRIKKNTCNKKNKYFPLFSSLSFYISDDIQIHWLILDNGMLRWEWEALAAGNFVAKSKTGNGATSQ
jgi:hypothetical protein